jgi:D-beta-D-heptose 7-phosphate kinase/D-beta-D-heptose 1-phosphate adenosyltransferase
VLHKGHRKLLEEAKSFGEVLIVGLNSDDSIKRLKGEERPINSAITRQNVLTSMEVADFVIVFDEDTPLELIRELMPAVLVKGGDYQVNEIIGRELVEEIRLVNLIAGVSTSILNSSNTSVHK